MRAPGRRRPTGGYRPARSHPGTGASHHPAPAPQPPARSRRRRAEPGPSGSAQGIAHRQGTGGVLHHRVDEAQVVGGTGGAHLVSVVAVVMVTVVMAAVIVARRLVLHPLRPRGEHPPGPGPGPSGSGRQPVGSEGLGGNWVWGSARFNRLVAHLPTRSATRVERDHAGRAPDPPDGCVPAGARGKWR